MADYIRREDYCEENCGKENREGYKTCTNCGMLNVPSADVQPVVHAYWMELPKALNPNENPCKCSNCGHVLSFMNGYPKSKYCDECGAKMDIIYEDGKVRAIKVTGWCNDARNLTDEETDICNDQLEAEAEMIDEISLL